MAIKISDSLLQSIANPKWSEDLGRVGQGLAQAPYLARKEAREKERQRQKLLTLNAYERGLSNVDTTADQRADVLSGMLQLGTEQNLDFTPEDINALRAQAQQNRGTTRGSAFKSAVLKKARDANRPEDVTLIQSLDPIQDREMLIQYFRTGTFGGSEKDNLVVVGNRIFDKNKREFISPEEDKKEEKVKLTFEKLENGDLIGLNPYTGEEVTRFSPNKNDPSGVKFMAIADAEYFIRDKIDPAIDFINKSIESRRTVGGVESVPFKYVPGTDEHTLVNQYYISIASDEAFAALEELRKQAMASGAKGSGLGQITQNEFRALKDNLTALQNAVELPPERQIELLNEIRERRLRIARLAGGEDPVNVVDWDSPALKEAGYRKGNQGRIYYQSLDGTQNILDRATGNFVPIK